MSLLALKNYMVKVKIASMNNLCCLFNKDPDTVRCLLDFWITKGKIRRCESVACASQCSSCPIATSESYEWLDNSSAVPRQLTCSAKVQ